MPQPLTKSSGASAADPHTRSRFGALLREWRGSRRMSQLHLGLEADVSSRHISFLETGRSAPSREMVLRLCEVLDVPLRQRNVLLQAAGFADLYRTSPLDDPELAPILHSVSVFLDRQDPYPAVLMDRHWNVLQQNRASTLLLGSLIDEPRAEFSNVLRLFFHPRGLRPWVVNWEEAGAILIQRLHREAAALGDDPEFRQLLDDIFESGDLPREWRLAALESDLPVVMPIHIEHPALELRLHTALTTLGTALDVTLNELKMETFLPVDQETEAALERLCARR